jgi:hypothetical protein
VLAATITPCAKLINTKLCVHCLFCHTIIEQFLAVVFAVGAAAHFRLASSRIPYTTALVCLFVFEVCCGVYLPVMATLRGLHVPEKNRAGRLHFLKLHSLQLHLSRLLL